ncbi:hypothetical protein QYE76_019218 [Lolium multiflorum]|uniref:Uncharacterized protein n=1 Tax=Lolium multiflorum TaxID=4521 RepID=A0AAD8VQ78_LOLMU|nr:hypothetical protein QYE76_019218 [Lolium multiflorum]
MSRLPTIGNCPECRQKKKDAANVSVFERLGPLPPRNKNAESSREEDLEEWEDNDEEEDKYHRPRWCPDGLSRSQKRRVQRLRGLEEAERLYLHTLRKARPDLAAKIQRTLDEEGRPQKKEWRPKQRKADDETSAGTNMVFILPTEFSALGLDEAPWDGDEVEVVHADDSAEISTADMNVWEAAGQEPLSGINLDDCERIDVTKDGVRLVLATGMTV